MFSKIAITTKMTEFSYSGEVRKVLRKFKVNLKREKIPFEKKSIFLAYGALNKYTEIYAIKNMEKQNKFYDEDVSLMPENLKNNLQSKSIHYYFE